MSEFTSVSPRLALGINREQRSIFAFYSPSVIYGKFAVPHSGVRGRQVWRWEDPGNGFETFVKVAALVARKLALWSLVAYLTAAACLYLVQAKLVFPAPDEFPRFTPGSVHLAFEDLYLPVVGREREHAWWISSEERSERVVLVFHGNGYVLEEMVSGEVTELARLGANLLLVDYRGYGLSSPVTPNEQTVNADAMAALAYLTQERHIAERAIYVLGKSVGSGPAVQLASSHSRLGGLILESPLSSIEDVASERLLFRPFPLRLLLRTHFDNVRAIGSVKVPVMILSGEEDKITPSWMAARLFERANSPKLRRLIRGATHEDVLEKGGPELLLEMREFVGSPRRE